MLLNWTIECQHTTLGLAKACNVLASPLNKNIFVVRLGRKLKEFRRPSPSPERWQQFIMKIIPIIAIIVTLFLFSRCTTDKTPSREPTSSETQSISKIKIHLLPAFDNDCVISIDKVLNIARFDVDTVLNFRHQGNVSPFESSLDSFKANTSIESFYSKTFRDSIRSNGDLAFDGLTIVTIIVQDNRLDTIDSGNLYPEILSSNIVSQLDYISTKTKDTALKNYISKLRKYFN
jgi:hypothetical protein